MNQYITGLADLDKSCLAMAGGKGANLGELNRIPGILVPPGFCVTTRAYKHFVLTSTEFDRLLSTLESIGNDSLDRLTTHAEEIRTHLLSLPIPKAVEKEIVDELNKGGSGYAYAVRSSATAEDLPGTSFAGQQDTYLNVRGQEQVLRAVRKCWASLFTERAVVYRLQNSFSHRDVELAVVVQQMVFPEVSGIMFTADPVSGNRRITSIDASFGLGEALVSGLVSADLYQVKDDQIVKKQVSKKSLLIKAQPEGGTERADILEEDSLSSSLSDEQALQLARIGRKIEDHFGNPQDIEWAIMEDRVYVLQSRPITTLYPQPNTNDEKIHLFISIGHPQMMTEAMKPLGISVLRTLIPFGKTSATRECEYLQAVGNRLYADITPLLRYPKVRELLPQIVPALDESISRSIEAFLIRDEFKDALRIPQRIPWSVIKVALPTFLKIAARILYRNNDRVLEEMNHFIKQNVDKNRGLLGSVSGVERIIVIQDMLSTLMPEILPRVAQSLPPAIGTYFLINKYSQVWLGDDSELRSISKSPPGNVTTEMGLELGDLADSLRAYPEVIDYLKTARDDTFFENLKQVPGSQGILTAIDQFFTRYGMRGTGEIDLSRPRWYETPTQIIPLLLINIEENQPGKHRREFAHGKEEAEKDAQLILERLRKKTWGFFRSRLMKRFIKVHRTLIGIREHPKYYMVQNFGLLKEAILEESDRLVEAGVFADREDIFWFSLAEIRDMIAHHKADLFLMAQRKETYARNKRLTPPRVITSEGEIIPGIAIKDLPSGALSGSPVSAGVVEGRARVILHLEEAKMDRGDILVAPYTDPSWTPLFTLAAGLVTEVGGLMTHGAVVAREYGIPAVVGVENATRIIKDGQQIQVDGTQGFVKVLHE